MGKTKLATGILVFKGLIFILIITVVGLFIQQNIAAFQSPQAFSLDLYIVEKGVTHIKLVNLLFLSALVGLVAGIALMLKPYLHVRRMLAGERAAKGEGETAGRASGQSVTGQEVTAQEAATLSEQPVPEKPAQEVPPRVAGS